MEDSLVTTLVSMLRESIETNRKNNELLANMISNVAPIMHQKSALISFEEAAVMLGNCDIKMVREMAKKGLFKTVSGGLYNKEKVVVSSITDYLDKVVRSGSTEYHHCPQVIKRQFDKMDFSSKKEKGSR